MVEVEVNLPGAAVAPIHLVGEVAQKPLVEEGEVGCQDQEPYLMQASVETVC